MPNSLVRPLSPIERWYWILDQNSPLNAITRVRVHGALDPAALRTAADALAARHPLLRVAIAADADGANPRFQPTDAQIPVRSIGGHESTWEQEVNSVELTESTDWANGPLARILHVDIGDAHDVVFVAAHIIADGRSALALLQDLVTFAAAAQGGTAPEVTALATFDPPEQRLPTKFRGRIGAARGMGIALAGQLRIAAARPRRLPAQAEVAPALRRTRLLRRELGGDELQRLGAACRTHGVSIHGALCAALASAVGAQLTPGRAGKLAIGSPVDFRAELVPPVGPEEAGAYACTLPTVLEYGPDINFWDIADRINRDLRARTAAQQHFALVAMLRIVTPKSLARSANAMRLAEQRGPGNVYLSNLGRFDFADRIGDWTLSGALVAGGISTTGYFLAAVNSSHGTLFWNFTYIEEMVSRERAERIADDTVELIRKALS